jgi:hypothetical protein
VVVGRRPGARLLVPDPELATVRRGTARLRVRLCRGVGCFWAWRLSITVSIVDRVMEGHPRCGAAIWVNQRTTHHLKERKACLFL